MLLTKVGSVTWEFVPKMDYHCGGHLSSCVKHLADVLAQVLTERALSIVDDIIVFNNSLKFYLIVIT